MRSIRLYLALHAACLGVIFLPGSVCAQDARTLSGLSEIPLPGGIKAALAVINDPVPPDRGQFLVEMIRRTYATQVAVRTDPRDRPLRALLAHLERERHANAQSSSDTLPLPLTPAIWIDVVFGGRNRRVQALDTQTGKELWQFAAKQRVDSSPVIVGQRVFVGSGDGRLYAFDLASGKELWQFEAGGDFAGSPAVAAGRLVIANEAGVVYCFGQEKP